MSSAAILAGGRASRFGGTDKSLLVVEGRSILERQVAELSCITDDLLLVGAGSPPNGSGGLRIVPDRVPGCGPLGGLDAALAAARDPEIVVIACDMPFVTARLLNHLLALVPGVDAVVPRTERGYHPLCAVYTRGCQGAVTRRLADRRLQMVGLLEDVRVRVVTREQLDAFGDCDRLFGNVNTQADLDQLKALNGHEL